MPKKQYSLEQFAYRRQAPMDAIMNTAFNVVLVVASLWGLDSVNVVPPPPREGSFSHSLFGTLLPMAIVMTMVITIVGVRVTVKKRIAGDVHPPLEPGVRWFRHAFTAAIFRAFAAFGLVSMFGLIIHYAWPLATMSVPLAAVVVGVVAAVLAYVESVGAVLKTRAIG